MKTAVFAFNPFQENTYLLFDDTKECVIIDAGNYSEREDKTIIKFIEDNGLKPVMAINTHGHVDHMLGVDTLKSTYGIPFAISSDDKFLIETAPTHGAIYGFNVKGVPAIEIDLKGMDKVTFGNTVLRIIPTPGHTPGHVCLYNEAEKTIFTGDTLFKESIGRTDLPGGDYSWIMKSILNNLVNLPADVDVYSGHGPKTTIGHEVLYNPFITEVVQGDVKY